MPPESTDVSPEKGSSFGELLEVASHRVKRQSRSVFFCELFNPDPSDLRESHTKNFVALVFSSQPEGLAEKSHGPGRPDKALRADVLAAEHHHGVKGDVPNLVINSGLPICGPLLFDQRSRRPDPCLTWVAAIELNSPYFPIAYVLY